MIESFARVAKTHTNMHLTIVGKGADKARLKSIAESLGVHELVTFTGNVPIDEY